MQKFKIVIDGIDAIGKTTITKKIFKKLNAKNISYYRSHQLDKELIDYYKGDFNVIEQSISYRLVELQQLISLGVITRHQYNKFKKFYEKNIHLDREYLHIYFYGSKEVADRNRKGMGIKSYQPFVDEMITKNLTNFYNKNSISYIIINVEDKNDLAYFYKLAKILSSTI